MAEPCQLLAQHHRSAVDAYQADIEAMEGRLRAPSRGPDDMSWRGRRADGHEQRAARARLERANRLMGATNNINRTLDQLAEAYGFATRSSYGASH
jgi:phosphatidylserine/phosphatidylglycerophosphate/cardiolipin synthase-like enzyme